VRAKLIEHGVDVRTGTTVRPLGRAHSGPAGLEVEATTVEGGQVTH
jgi:hypothetical protein